MTVLAAIRPDDWNFPLFLHVVGAMVLVGGLVVAVAAHVLGWARREPADMAGFGRAAFWSLLVVAVPGWVVMRVGAQWIYSKEGWSGEQDPSWLGVGVATADLGGIVLLVTLVLAGLGARQLARSGGTRNVLARIAAPVASILLVAYLVAVWAMTAKPD